MTSMLRWTEDDLKAHMGKVGKSRFVGVGQIVAAEIMAGVSAAAERERQAAKPVKPAKRQKFNAQKTQTSDGVWCDSKAEARRWEELKLMQRAGQIEYMLPHPSFPLFVNGKRTGRMTFDALYVEAGGPMVLEDTKSAVTAKATAYRQRLKTFQACYPHITVREHIV